MEGSVSDARLIVICGLPGSGKTMLAKALEQRLGGIRFCPDEWMEALSLDIWDEERRARIEALQWRLGRELLARGLVVIIEWGTWGRAERDTLREGARALGAAVELHYLPATEEMMWERIERRRMEDPPTTREALAQWINAFQAPTEEEWRCSTRCRRRMGTKGDSRPGTARTGHLPSAPAAPCGGWTDSTACWRRATLCPPALRTLLRRGIPVDIRSNRSTGRTKIGAP